MNCVANILPIFIYLQVEEQDLHIHSYCFLTVELSLNVLLKCNNLIFVYMEIHIIQHSNSNNILVRMNSSVFNVQGRRAAVHCQGADQTHRRVQYEKNPINYEGNILPIFFYLQVKNNIFISVLTSTFNWCNRSVLWHYGLQRALDTMF